MLYLNLGRRETGKTTLALYLTRRQTTRVIFDPRGLCPAPDGRCLTEDDIARGFDALIAVPTQTQLVITPDRGVQRCFERTAREIRQWVKEDQPPLAFVVDELRFVDSTTDDFDWLLRCVPTDQLVIVTTAHRPTDVVPDMRAIADVWCVFQTTERRDLDALAERTSPRVVERVPSLPPRQFISWDDQRAIDTWHRDPALWHVPLARDRRAAGVSTALPAGTALVSAQGTLLTG